MTHSGKFVLRVSPTTHSRLKVEAARKKLSLNELVKQKIESTPHGSDTAIDISQIENLWRDSLVGIVLFGSTARGEDRTNSDIDLLIILKNEIPINRDLYKIWDKNFSPTHKVVSPQFVHLKVDFTSASSLWLEVALDGIILSDKSGDIKKCLVKLKDLIASGRYQRKLSYGQPYWVKNAK